LIFISERHSRGDTGFLVLVFKIEKKRKEDKILVFRGIPDLYERKESCESAGRNTMKENRNQKFKKSLVALEK